ncbi:hypothetical protein [Oceanobacillus kimchii]|uniref:Uncharacterized protein n=1 Tax=Oceanobacillus kimchii TaxID=746691 RepID=A0ABQ5TKF3_9BACI|nr:hypothetical protein [Oceanobacillus kimchii]GLO66164.1 hypothetical protein MACH08_19480 [Oceanobacillus kimchii]
MHKTAENWNCDLNKYLQIGDTVDEELYNHFVNVLPPATYRNNLVQIGEPYSTSKENKSTYQTLKKIDGNWTYVGTCHIGDNQHQESLY